MSRRKKPKVEPAKIAKVIQLRPTTVSAGISDEQWRATIARIELNRSAELHVYRLAIAAAKQRSNPLDAEALAVIKRSLDRSSSVSEPPPLRSALREMREADTAFESSRPRKGGAS